jgi:hypothetical protein
MREKNRLYIPPIERADLEETLSLLHSQMEDATLLRYWEEGRASSDEQVFNRALAG